jgi:RNA polymerase sigma factor (sigma-70 family)
MDASVFPGHPGYARRSRAALRLASDKRLVALVRAGETVGFEALYDRHARKLLSFCRHMLGSQQDGEDALQRTFASAYRALLVDEREIELRPWLFAIARNECLSILRQRHPTGALDETEPATEGLSARVEGREDLRDLLADLRALPERQRAALLLSELGGLTHAQIADAVGARPEQIKAYVFQARSNLIAERDARERSCLEVREQLASRRGRARLQRELSRHLRRCRDCRVYSAALRRQRRAMAIVLPVAPSLALRSAVLNGALGSAHGASASTGIAGAGLAEPSLAEAGLALTNNGGNALLAKGLTVIALAGVSAGAGTIALNGVGRHHAPVDASSAKAGSADRVPASPRHPIAPLRSWRSPTPSARPPRRAALSPARSDGPRTDAAGGVAAGAKRDSTPTRMVPLRRSPPAANGQGSPAAAPTQLAPVPSKASGLRGEPGISSNGRGGERGGAKGDAGKARTGGRGGSKSASPSAGHAAHGNNVSSPSGGTATSSAAGEGSGSARPAHAVGAEPGRSTLGGLKTGAGSGGTDPPGNSASAPGHNG